MRTVALILASTLALASPALAQNNNGLGGIINRLDNALNPNDNRQQPSQQNYDRNYGNYDQRDRSGGYSGSSNFEPRYEGNRMVLRGQDSEMERQRLDYLQQQINDAQRRLNREKQDYDRAVRD
jgi:hypothetical protein